MDAANENLNLLNMTEQEKIIPAGENAETDNQPELMDESVQEAIKENEQEAVPEITDGEVITQTEKKKKVRTHASLAKNIVSLVFFTLSLVFGITASTLFLVRESLTTQSVSQSVKNMTLGDTGIGFWFGQQGQDVTLDEYMTDVFNSSGVVSVQQKDVKKFLDSAFVKNFVTDRLNGYISDFMYGTGEGSINVDEVMSLLGDNWAEVSVKLGIDNAKVKGKTQDDIRAEVLTGVYNRLVVLNNDMTEVVNIIDSFDNNGAKDGFKSPYGVCISENGQLYVADSQNHRIVVMEKDGTLVRIVDNPQSQSLDAGYVFVPLKVTVDYADRIYCIAQNMFEGIMVFETNGEFSGFFGTIDVKITLWEKFWKRIATKEERSKQQLYIPTEFTGIDVDADGFIYATNIDSAGVQAVRRLNPRGEDVIKKGENKNVGGDLAINGQSQYAGASQITDVVYRDKGIYTVLDRKRGRIFTYDHEGNLLYIFGGLGTQLGTFNTPVAIEVSGDKLVVLDAYRAELTVFNATEYGSLINEAIALRYDGDETLAVEKWREVLRLDENNELANIGIGKAYLTAGDNRNAMKYLKLGMDSDYYSIAFRRYRNQVLADNLSYIFTGIAVVIIAIVVIVRIRSRKHGKGGEKA